MAHLAPPFFFTRCDFSHTWPCSIFASAGFLQKGTICCDAGFRFLVVLTPPKRIAWEFQTGCRGMLLGNFRHCTRVIKLNLCNTIAVYSDALCNRCARALTLVITSAPRRFVSNPARSRALSSRATISRRVLTRAAISECTGGGDTRP